MSVYVKSPVITVARNNEKIKSARTGLDWFIVADIQFVYPNNPALMPSEYLLLWKNSSLPCKTYIPKAITSVIVSQPFNELSPIPSYRPVVIMNAKKKHDNDKPSRIPNEIAPNAIFVCGATNNASKINVIPVYVRNIA